MRKYLLLIFILCCSTSLWAQQQTISGVVKDNSGAAIEGVNISIKGTTSGAITDLDGHYTLSVSNNSSVLNFSFIGYTAQELTVGNRTTINVVLEDDVIGLGEVVAIGYGVQKKSDLTGSVEVVKSETLTKQAVFQTSQGLAGVVPGLTAIQSSGQPGSDGSTLVIRGVGSMSASSNPLVLIDGVEGSLDGVDSNDIENISILKDAGASAIYGSRASNGVILVTTKRGVAGDVKVSYSGYIGFQNPTDIPEFVGAEEYLELTGDDVLLEQYLANPNDKDNYPDTDWADLLFSESGAMQYHNLSISGGSNKAKIKASLSYQNQDGNIPNFGFKRYQGRLNSDFTASSMFDVSLDINFRQSITNTSPFGNGVRDTYRQPATFPAIYSDGRYAFPATGGNTIAGVNESGTNTTTGNYFRGVIKALFKPIEQVSISATYSPEISESYSKSFKKQYEVYEGFDATTPLILSSGSNNEVTVSQTTSRSNTNNFTAIARYGDSFEDHNVEAMAGYEMIKYESEYFSASRYGYIIQDFPVIDNGNAENDDTSGNADQNGLASYFGRVNYSYADRYLAAVNMRSDGSSRFAEDNRWGFFPSFSLGWNIHNESFFPQDLVLNRVKLRGSWGQLGNQSIDSSFPYASLIAIGSSHYANGAIQQGAAQQTLSNSAISWETAENTNIGVDFGMLNNKLSGSVEYYIRKTSDLLGSQKIPYTTGLGTPTANVYSMENRGWDLSLSWKDEVGEFKYAINGNFSTLTNEVTDLNGVDFLISGSSIKKIGEPVNSLYGYESMGMFRDQDEIDGAPTQFGTLTPGDIRFKDQLTVDTNGDLIPDETDGVINEEDKTIIGNPFPETSFGLNLSAEYKGLDLSIALQGVANRDVLLSEYLVQPLFNAGNITKWQVEESWTPENLDARYPVLKNYSGSSNNSKPNSTYMFDASYLRVRNVTLGYSLPKTVVDAVTLKSVRLYISGQNLLTFDSMPQGVDPLIPNGAKGYDYPVVKTYTFGVSVGF